MPRRQPQGRSAALRAALQAALSEHFATQETGKDLEARARMLRDTSVVPAFRDAGIQSTTFTVELGDGTKVIMKATCNPDPDPDYVVDEGRLRKAMGSDWSKVTKAVLDKDKLNQWLLDGSPEERKRREHLVGSVMTEKARTPFPRYTRMEVVRPEEDEPEPEREITSSIEVPTLTEEPPIRRRKVQIPV